MSMSPKIKDDIIYWLALKQVQGIGNVIYKKLINAFNTPDRIFKAPIEELRKAEGIPESLLERIKAFNSFEEHEKELQAIKHLDVSIITFNDESYPPLLKQINDPPPYLYVKGDLSIKNNKVVAVVGTRYPSPYGQTATKELAQRLVEEGYTIVSGMARGIDSMAHKSAIDNKGRTVAVFGCGINVVYPESNKELSKKIIDHGALITEYSINTPPLQMNFPERNRIISGMATALIVVEASLNSGTMITVSHALDQGREVFAAPGQIYSMMSQGTNRLIKHGATMIDSIDTLIEELNNLTSFEDEDKRPQQVPDAYVDILKYISNEPVALDTVISQSNIETSKVMSILTEMELNGFVKQLPGKRYIKME